MQVFIDTNILINSLKDSGVLKKRDRYFINPIVYSETLYGILYCGKEPRELDRHLQTHGVKVVDISRETATLYTKRKLELNRQGTPLEDNDLLIASSCLEHGLPLLTNNTKHFKRVRGLELK
mgnify:CR=1 FL=1|jgi:tRNA(fMet)-specific endonuclease VapC